MRIVRLGLLAAFLAAVPAARGEESSRASRPSSSLKTEVGGGVRFSGLFREDWFDAIWPRSGPAGEPQDETFLQASLALDARLRPVKAVTLVVALETASDAFGGENHRVGDNANVPRFREGWVRVEDLFGKPKEGEGVAARLQVGLMAEDLCFHLGRFGRDAFFLDPAHAENPFAGVPGYVQPGTDPGATQTANTFLGGNPWFNRIPGVLKEPEAGGFRFTLTPVPDVVVDAGAFTVLEGGLADSSLGVSAAFVHLSLPFDVQGPPRGKKRAPEERSLLNFLFTGIQGKDVFVADGGVGLDLVLRTGEGDAEVFLEAHYQNGEYARTRDAAGERRSVWQEAWAGTAGARFLFGGAGALDPYLEVSAAYLSGDSGDLAEKNNDYLSFESVDSALILESAWGLDVDCNHWAVKAEGGLKLPVAGNTLKAVLFAGYFELVRAPAAWKGTEREDRRRLGFEVDARLAWTVCEEVEFFAAYAFLGDAQFFHEATGAANHASVALAGVRGRF
ncbi:MAG: hypothetical protein MUC63_10345 [Planctomycetes bacterium]|nr:hypothetical protein [Planctomycetota bacterium]